jgi:hypothetical protein
VLNLKQRLKAVRTERGGDPGFLSLVDARLSGVVLWFAGKNAAISSVHRQGKIWMIMSLVVMRRLSYGFDTHSLSFFMTISIYTTGYYAGKAVT